MIGPLVHSTGRGERPRAPPEAAKSRHGYRLCLSSALFVAGYVITTNVTGQPGQPPAAVPEAPRLPALFVTNIPCDMQVVRGVRAFGFHQELSAEQAKSLQKVIVKRVYQ